MFKIIVKIKKIINFIINQCLKITTKTSQLIKQEIQILKQLNYQNLLQEYKTIADLLKPPMILVFYDLKNK
jgi:hypothetical protein